MSEQTFTNKNITAEINSNTIDIYDSVKGYVNDHNPVLYILTPCYGSVCFVNFVHCLMQTKELFLTF